MQPRTATPQNESRRQVRTSDLMRTDRRKKWPAVFGQPNRDTAIRHSRAAKRYMRTRLRRVQVEGAKAELLLPLRLEGGPPPAGSSGYRAACVSDETNCVRNQTPLRAISIQMCIGLHFAAV